MWTPWYSSSRLRACTKQPRVYSYIDAISYSLAVWTDRHSSRFWLAAQSYGFGSPRYLLNLWLSCQFALKTLNFPVFPCSADSVNFGKSKTIVGIFPRVYRAVLTRPFVSCLFYTFREYWGKRFLVIGLVLTRKSCAFTVTKPTQRRNTGSMCYTSRVAVLWFFVGFSFNDIGTFAIGSTLYTLSPSNLFHCSAKWYWFFWNNSPRDIIAR